MKIFKWKSPSWCSWQLSVQTRNEASENHLNRAYWIFGSSGKFDFEQDIFPSYFFTEHFGTHNRFMWYPCIGDWYCGWPDISPLAFSPRRSHHRRTHHSALSPLGVFTTRQPHHRLFQQSNNMFVLVSAWKVGFIFTALTLKLEENQLTFELCAREKSSSDNFHSEDSGFPLPTHKIRNTNGGIEVSDLLKWW